MNTKQLTNSLNVVDISAEFSEEIILKHNIGDIFDVETKHLPQRHLYSSYQNYMVTAKVITSNKEVLVEEYFEKLNVALEFHNYLVFAYKG